MMPTVIRPCPGRGKIAEPLAEDHGVPVGAAHLRVVDQLEGGDPVIGERKSSLFARIQLLEAATRIAREAGGQVSAVSG